MQLNIIPLAEAGRLQVVHQDLHRNGIQPMILVGSQYTTPYFLEHLVRLVTAGARVILANDCTQLQISSAIEASKTPRWQDLPNDVQIHLVRQA